MKTLTLRAGEDFIKYAVEEGKVLVNGEVCTMRGKKIHSGDTVSYMGEEIAVKA